jgi:hypothetical protein
VIKEAKRIEESTLYSAKGHFAAAHFWSKFHLWVGLPATILAAVAAAAAFSQFDQHHEVGGWISIIVAVLSAVTTFLNPNEKSASHLRAANSYDALHNRARIVWTIDCGGSDSDQVVSNRLRDLSELKNELNRKSPQIPRFAYNLGKKGILAGEADYLVDKPK